MNRSKNNSIRVVMSSILRVQKPYQVLAIVLIFLTIVGIILYVFIPFQKSNRIIRDLMAHEQRASEYIPNTYYDLHTKSYKTINLNINYATHAESRAKQDYEVVNNNFRTYFKKMSEGQMLFIEKDIEDLEQKVGKVNLGYSLENNSSLGVPNQVEGIIENNTITYKSIFKEIDFKVTVKAEKLVQEYIVHSPSTAKIINDITESLILDGLDYKQNADGSIELVKDGQIVFIIQRPVMYEYDNKSVADYGIIYKVSKKNDKLFISKVLTDEGKAWIADMNRKYPIVIDPTTVDTSTSSSPTAYSFQRKTWHDGTRYWIGFHSLADERIEFWYSTDGASWSENTTARIDLNTNDFSIHSESSSVFINYTLNNDIKVREAVSYPSATFAWGLEKSVMASNESNEIGFRNEHVFNPASTQYLSTSALSSNAFVMAYADFGNSERGTAIIGTVAGDKIFYGSEYVFNSAATYYTSVVALSSSKFVITYSDGGNGDRGTAIIGTIASGTVISYGSEYSFHVTQGSFTAVAALLDNKFVVAFSDSNIPTYSNYGKAIIGTVSGTTISYGSENTFNTGLTTSISVSSLSDGTFVIAYKDGGSSGNAIIGTISGTTISYGSEYAFNSAATDYVAVSALTNSSFIVAYQDTGNSSYGTATVGTVSTTTISFGSEYAFNSATTTYISVLALDNNSFVTAYRDEGNSNYGTATIGRISSTVVSYGSEYVFNSAATTTTALTAFGANSFVTVYTDAGNSSYGTCVVGSTNPNISLTWGSEYVFNSASTTGTSITPLTSDTFVVAYVDVGNSSNGTAIIGTVSGTTIAYGSEYVFNAASTAYVSASSLSSTSFVIAYQDTGSSSNGMAIIGTVSGTTIAYGSEYVFNAASTAYVSVAPLNSSSFIIAYQDAGNSNYLTTIVGMVSGTDISYGSEYAQSYFANFITISTNNNDKFVISRGAGMSSIVTIGTVSGTSVTYDDSLTVSGSITNTLKVKYLNSDTFACIFLGALKIGKVVNDTISLGMQVNFNTSGTAETALTAIDGSKIIITYQDTGNSNYGTVIVGNIVDTNVTFSGEYVFNSGATSYTSVVKLAHDKAAIVYADGGVQHGTALIAALPTSFATYGNVTGISSTLANSAAVTVVDSNKFVVASRWNSQGRAVVGIVNGATISYGAEYVFNPAETVSTTLETLDRNKFVISYYDGGNSDHGTAIIGTVSGTSISYGSEYVFNSASTNFTKVVKIADNVFAVTYTDVGNSDYGTAIIGTVSGTAISYGLEYVFNSAYTSETSLTSHTTNAFMVVYQDAGNSYFGTGRVGTVSGTTISYGLEYVFNSDETTRTWIGSLTTTKNVIGYNDGGNSSYGTAIIATISGTIISYGSEYVFNFGTTSNISLAPFNDSTFVVVYEDGSNSNYGTTTIGKVSGTTVTFSLETVTLTSSNNYYSIKPLNSNDFIIAYVDGTTFYEESIFGSILPIYKNPTTAKGSNDKIWTTASKKLASGYSAVTTQSQAANDGFGWNHQIDLGFSLDSGTHGIVTSRSLGSVYAIWKDTNGVRGKNYDGTNWDIQAETIGMSLTGAGNNISVLNDSNSNVHLAYINSSNQTIYRQYTTSWQTAVVLDANSGNEYPSISLDSSNNKMAVAWINGNDIFLKTSASPYTTWDGVASTIETNGTNDWLTSSLISENSSVVFLWTQGTGSPFDVKTHLVTFVNYSPSTPSLDVPLDTAINQLVKPVLRVTSSDVNNDYLRYKIQICENLAMSQNCQTFDQTSSQTGWSGQDAESGTAYSSGTQGTYTLQNNLSYLTTYYWRSYAIDPAGTNTWSSTQTTPYSFTTLDVPAMNLRGINMQGININ